MISNELISSVQPGEVVLKFNVDTLISFIKMMDHEYHLPSYEKFLDELDNSLKYYGGIRGIQDPHQGL